MSEPAARLPVVDDFSRLLGEQEAIEMLALDQRPNPRGALRWLMRMRKLPYVRLGRGIYGFRRQDLEAFIRTAMVPARSARGRLEKP